MRGTDRTSLPGSGVTKTTATTTPECFVAARRSASLLVCLSLLAVLWPRAVLAVTLEELRERGQVRLGIANEAPYAYVNADGTVTGEAPEVAKAVFESMGISDVEAIVVEFGALIPGLKAGRFDVVAAGMYVTPKRCRQVLFSEPSYRIGEGFLVRAGNPRGLHSYEDVRRMPAVTLGVVAGTVEQGYARKVGIPESRILVLPDNATGLAAVRSGRIDAYGGTSLTIRRLAEAAEGVEAAEPFTDPVIDGRTVAGYGAFAFHRRDDPLRTVFNRNLKRFLGSDAWRDTVHTFGFGDHTLPDKTTEELCRR